LAKAGWIATPGDAGLAITGKLYQLRGIFGQRATFILGASSEGFLSSTG
jgi:hypothetical protein